MIAAWMQPTILAGAASFLRMSNLPDTISGTHHPNKGVRVCDAGIEVSKNLPDLDSWSLESEWVVSEEALSAERSAEKCLCVATAEGPRNRCQGHDIFVDSVAATQLQELPTYASHPKQTKA
jgi:hypothetical protein